MNEENAVITGQHQLPSVPSGSWGQHQLPSVPSGSWGQQDTSSKDMLLPSLLLMQDISDLVKKEQAKAGSIVNNVSSQVLAGRGDKLDIIPILTFREWEVNELVADRTGKIKEQFVRRVRMTAENEEGPYEFDEHGKTFRQHRTIVCFVLVASQTSELPYLVRFKKTGLYAGKKLSTHFQMCGMKDISPARQVFGLYGETQVSNDNTYYAFNLTPTRETTKEEEAVAYRWWKTLSSKDVKVGDAEGPVPF